jgi:hypothetical protein
MKGADARLLLQAGDLAFEAGDLTLGPLDNVEASFELRHPPSQGNLLTLQANPQLLDAAILLPPRNSRRIRPNYAAMGVESSQ